MNEQDKVLARQSKWSGRRVILLYWFSIVFLGSAAAVGLGATVLNPKFTYQQDPHSGITEPWHAEDCSPCHDEIIDAWEDTKHSYILDEFTNTTGTYVNHTTSGDIYDKQEWLEGSGCCHKTRWTNDTSVVASGNLSVWDIGISCAACHIEPGAPYNSSAYKPTVGVGRPPFWGKTCAAGCHVPGSRGPTWYASGHPNSLVDLLATGVTDDSCLHCMSGQGLYMDDAELTAYDDSFLTSVDCVTCHDPHNVDGYNKHDLRVGSTTELCGTCHVGPLDAITDATFPMTNSTLDMSCTDCHGYEFVAGHNSTDRFGVTTWVDAAFSDLQHNWVTPSKADDCSRCHGDENGTRWDTITEAQENISLYLSGVQEFLVVVRGVAVEAKGTTNVDAAKVANVMALIDEAEVLLEFVEFDPSNGFHNPDLAMDKLELAMTKLKAAETAAHDAIANPVEPTTEPETTEETTTEETTPGTTPGFELAGILLAFCILGTGAILFHRKKR